MNSNILFKTRTYLVGHMEFVEGRDWRKWIMGELTKMGVVVFNPYEKPFLMEMDEGVEKRKELKEALANFELANVSAHMKKVRAFDLNLVDRSDFIIAHIVPHVASWGSAEEITTAVRMKKPIFISVEGGVSKTPLWLLGQLPPDCFYNNVGEVMTALHNIDDGTNPIDNSRWRLLRKDLR